MSIPATAANTAVSEASNALPLLGAPLSWNGRCLTSGGKKANALTALVNNAIGATYPGELIAFVGTYTVPLENHIASVGANPALLDSEEEFSQFRDFLLQNKSFLQELTPHLLMLFFHKAEAKQSLLALSSEEHNRALLSTIVEAFQAQPEKLRSCSVHDLVALLKKSTELHMSNLVTHIETLLIENECAKLMKDTVPHYIQVLSLCTNAACRDAIHKKLLQLETEEPFIQTLTGQQLAQIFSNDTKRTQQALELCSADYFQRLLHKVLTEVLRDGASKLCDATTEADKTTLAILAILAESVADVTSSKVNDDFYRDFPLFGQAIKKCISERYGRASFSEVSTAIFATDLFKQALASQKMIRDMCNDVTKYTVPLIKLEDFLVQPVVAPEPPSLYDRFLAFFRRNT